MIDIQGELIDWGLDNTRHQIGPAKYIFPLPAFKGLLHDACAAHDKSKLVPSEHVLRHFSIVGATLIKEGILEIDALRICNSIQTLLLAGFAIDPNFELDFVRFEEGRDFLDENHPTDVAVLCNLNDANKDKYTNCPEKLQKALEAWRT